MYLSKLVIWGSSWGRGFRFPWLGGCPCGVVGSTGDEEMSCDIHTHTPARKMCTNFLLCSFVIHNDYTNYLGHGHGYECHSPGTVRPISILGTSEPRFVDSSFPGSPLMGLGTPPLKIKLPLESTPPEVQSLSSEIGRSSRLERVAWARPQV